MFSILGDDNSVLIYFIHAVIKQNAWTNHETRGQTNHQSQSQPSNTDTYFYGFFSTSGM